MNKNMLKRLHIQIGRLILTDERLVNAIKRYLRDKKNNPDYSINLSACLEQIFKERFSSYIGLSFEIDNYERIDACKCIAELAIVFADWDEVAKYVVKEIISLCDGWIEVA